MGIDSDERVTPEAFASLDAFQQKDFLIVHESAQHRNRGFKIGKQFRAYGNQIAFPAEFFKTPEIRFQHFFSPHLFYFQFSIFQQKKPHPQVFHSRGCGLYSGKQKGGFNFSSSTRRNQHYKKHTQQPRRFTTATAIDLKCRCKSVFS